MSKPNDDNLAAEMVAFMATPVDHALYTDEDRMVLLRVYNDGSREVAIRDPLTRSWGPPIPLTAEPVLELIDRARETADLLSEMGGTA